MKECSGPVSPSRFAHKNTLQCFAGWCIDHLTILLITCLHILFAAPDFPVVENLPCRPRRYVA